MKTLLPLVTLLLTSSRVYCWGFYMHEKINYHAVFLLPPPMMLFFKPNIGFLTGHAVDPDKRRYILASEGARHYLDIDRYGKYPFAGLPRRYSDALEKYSADTIQAYGIVPWWIQIMLGRLTRAFREKNSAMILKYAAEIGHYIADAHVPLHVCSNHNGQMSHQEGIHAFWESRVPELFAEQDWDFFVGKAEYIPDPSKYIWDRILESAAASDTVLSLEKKLSEKFPADQKYAFEDRQGKLVKQYSRVYSQNYENSLNHMIERRMRQSILSVASFWYTAWINAGQPVLDAQPSDSLSSEDQKEFERLNLSWKNGSLKGRSCND